MTDEEALAATEAFARKVAAEAARGMRRNGDVVGMFAAVHRGVAAAYSLGFDVGRLAIEPKASEPTDGVPVVVKVPHTCCGCGAEILPGERAERISGIGKDGPYARYRCWACS